MKGLTKITDYLWEIPKTGDMRVPGRIYITAEMLANQFDNNEAFKQVANVAHLPGIQKYSIAMPDIHWGYGFPIGGVAATDLSHGVISPGGVGYDINCGVRLAATNLTIADVSPKINELVNKLFSTIPTGVGSAGAIKKIDKLQLNRAILQGSAWSIEMGFGTGDDLLFTEEGGKLPGASIESLSERVYERAINQIGTLGSGNHFLEVDVVDEIFDEKTATAFGLFKGQIVILIHTGSRAFGYQVCDDFIKIHLEKSMKSGIKLPDKQLACAPINSPEGEDYLTSMNAAANFAWNNRQVIMHLSKQALLDIFKIPESSLGFRLVYDVCHNIAKIEEHKIGKTIKKVCVHRKGATRAFPKNNPHIPKAYMEVGQPVLIPGDMGRYSYVCVGSEKAMAETFGSSCHGAGRILSRTKALKEGKGRNLIDELRKKGIIVKAKGTATVAEEMSSAYKDVSDVVEVMHQAGITPRVAKLRPIGVIKG